MSLKHLCTFVLLIAKKWMKLLGKEEEKGNLENQDPNLVNVVESFTQ